MPSQTNEQALEASIEKALTGQCQEEVKSLFQVILRKLLNHFLKV